MCWERQLIILVGCFGCWSTWRLDGRKGGAWDRRARKGDAPVKFVFVEIFFGPGVSPFLLIFRLV